MTYPIILMICGCVVFGTIICIAFVHACELSREHERGQAPDYCANELRGRDGDIIHADSTISGAK